jgi:hypothetical protein
MTDCKSSLTPFLIGLKLEDGGEIPLVDSTMYIQQVGRFCISRTPYQTSLMQLVQFPSSYRSHMRYIGRIQSVSFDTYREPSPLGFIMK